MVIKQELNKTVATVTHHVATRRLLLWIIAALAPLTAVASPSPWLQAVTGGSPSIDLRLRYESVSQDNPLDDAQALTLRSLLAWQTLEHSGWTARLGFHDSRPVLGVNDYSVPQTGYKPGQYSVIADPATTELDEAWLQYGRNGLTVRAGRQVLAWDDQRFIGDVGWRQDRQTFDAVSLRYQPMEKLSLQYAWVAQRNRIFAQDADVDAADQFLNAAWVTPLGTLAGFGYLLDADDSPQQGPDSWGLRFSGERAAGTTKLNYAASWATQSSSIGSQSFNADYLYGELGAAVARFNVKLGYEVLGSDHGQYGFATPLATLHKFNGWADQFLDTPPQGLQDLYLALGGALLGGQWQAAWHDFEADDPTPLAGEFGEELDLLYTRLFAEHFTVGVKYALFEAGDAPGGRVDTDKFWTWLSVIY